MNLDHFIESVIIKIDAFTRFHIIHWKIQPLTLTCISIFFNANSSKFVFFLFKFNFLYGHSLYSTNVIHISCEFHYIMNSNTKILVLLRYLHLLINSSYFMLYLIYRDAVLIINKIEYQKYYFWYIFFNSLITNILIFSRRFFIF